MPRSPQQEEEEVFEELPASVSFSAGLSAGCHTWPLGAAMRNSSPARLEPIPEVVAKPSGRRNSRSVGSQVRHQVFKVPSENCACEGTLKLLLDGGRLVTKFCRLRTDRVEYWDQTSSALQGLPPRGHFMLSDFVSMEVLGSGLLLNRQKGGRKLAMNIADAATVHSWKEALMKTIPLAGVSAASNTEAAPVSDPPSKVRRAAQAPAVRAATTPRTQCLRGAERRLSADSGRPGPGPAADRRTSPHAARVVVANPPRTRQRSPERAR